MNDEIESLEQKIKTLTPELDQKKEEYNKTAEDYYKIKNEVDDLQRRIDEIKKRIQVESFKKMTAGGEVVSFRQFFKEVREGRDFTNKTLIWCSKDGKSGFFVNLWVQNEAAHRILLEKLHNDHIYDPDVLLRLMHEFPSMSLDDFEFRAFTVGSMVDGHSFYDKKPDDIYISIHDTKTLDDFPDAAATKGLRFFKPGSLPYIEESLGVVLPERENSLSLRGTYVSKEHYKEYILYPAKAGHEGHWRH